VVEIAAMAAGARALIAKAKVVASYTSSFKPHTLDLKLLKTSYTSSLRPHTLDLKLLLYEALNY
jgi:hypothetical protein